jgi:hypothetical protein
LPPLKKNDRIIVPSLPRASSDDENSWYFFERELSHQIVPVATHVLSSHLNHFAFKLGPYRLSQQIVHCQHRPHCLPV